MYIQVPIVVQTYLSGHPTYSQPQPSVPEPVGVKSGKVVDAAAWMVVDAASVDAAVVAVDASALAFASSFLMASKNVSS